MREVKNTWSSVINRGKPLTQAELCAEIDMDLVFLYNYFKISPSQYMHSIARTKVRVRALVSWWHTNTMEDVIKSFSKKDK